MKNILILHGTDGAPEHNWFLWLKNYFVEKGNDVWVPQLPDADRPNSKKYNDFLLNSDWDFNSESIIIGHSSGAVETLALLEVLPNDVIVDTAILVGSFRGDLGWKELSELITKPLNLDNIKRKAKNFIIIHSDNDPFCPLEDAEYYAKELEGKLIVIAGAQHFTPSKGGEEYKKAQFILDALELQ